VNALCTQVADILAIDPARVFTASTGVIGEPLDHGRIIDRLTQMKSDLRGDGFSQAAHAIMTTDTFAKGSTAEMTGSHGNIRICGFAKGSGMIAPDMATMLAYIFTDAKISQPVLQAMLQDAANTTFNCITVDSDTSTSDTVLAIATGQNSATSIDSRQTAAGQAFYTALHKVMLDLAQQIVRDGEGASKFVEIRVTGATSDGDARTVALSVANSPLVKTAIAGQDPNWGRVVMAVGKSGAPANRDTLSIRFGDILVAENGWISPGYIEADGQAYMQRDELVITVDLGMGSAQATVWTCDLTHGYIDINADYRS